MAPRDQWVEAQEGTENAECKVVKSLEGIDDRWALPPEQDPGRQRYDKRLGIDPLCEVHMQGVDASLPQPTAIRFSDALAWLTEVEARKAAGHRIYGCDDPRMRDLGVLDEDGVSGPEHLILGLTRTREVDWGANPDARDQLDLMRSGDYFTDLGLPEKPEDPPLEECLLQTPGFETYRKGIRQLNSWTYLADTSHQSEALPYFVSLEEIPALVEVIESKMAAADSETLNGHPLRGVRHASFGSWLNEAMSRKSSGRLLESQDNPVGRTFGFVDLSEGAPYEYHFVSLTTIREARLADPDFQAPEFLFSSDGRRLFFRPDAEEPLI